MIDRVMVKKSCRYNKATKLFWNGKVRQHDFGNAVPLMAHLHRRDHSSIAAAKGSKTSRADLIKFFGPDGPLSASRCLSAQRVGYLRDSIRAMSASEKPKW